MNFIAEIDIMPRKELLDPQGKTVAKNIKNLQLEGIEEIRIGKHISIQLVADNEAQARNKVELACQKLLANMIMETFTYSLRNAE